MEWTPDLVVGIALWSGLMLVVGFAIGKFDANVDSMVVKANRQAADERMHDYTKGDAGGTSRS